MVDFFKGRLCWGRMSPGAYIILEICTSKIKVIPHEVYIYKTKTMQNLLVSIHSIVSYSLVLAPVFAQDILVIHVVTCSDSPSISSGRTLGCGPPSQSLGVGCTGLCCVPQHVHVQPGMGQSVTFPAGHLAVLGDQWVLGSPKRVFHWTNGLSAACSALLGEGAVTSAVTCISSALYFLSKWTLFDVQ